MFLHAVERGFFGTIPLGKSRAALTITYVNAAGIDIGSAAHFGAVPPDQDDEPVREFPSFTVDLHAIVDWLDACQVDTIAMESTGVYWIPLYGSKMPATAGGGNSPRILLFAGTRVAVTSA